MKTLTTLALTFFLTLSAGCSVTGQARAADDGYFSQAELDSMLAPVALYPDSVLSHVLIAATYPLEVIQAARWTRQHPGLRGEDAVIAVEHRNWDPSVKALVAFPELLERMDDDLDWTQRLGDAFLLQEEEVIASIQYLRSEAYSQGHLRSNDRVKIVREKEYIYIEPARTRLVYVPYYDPRVIYTHWRWSSYRPHYWHRPSGFSVSVNFHWGRPYHIRPSFYFSSFHWPTRKVVVVNHHHHYYRDRRFHSGRDVAHFKEARHWKHDPKHRRGVSYRGRVKETRFVESARSASTTRGNPKSISRESTRSSRRDWAAQRRSSQSFDRESRAREASSTRSQRVAELRGSRSDSRSSSRLGASETRATSRSRAESGLQARRGDRSESSESRARTVTGRAAARAESRERAAVTSRTSDSRAARISESLRSGSSSRASANSRSRGADRTSRLSERSASRSQRDRSSVSVPRGLTVRSSSGRERSSAPSRSQSSRSASPSRGSSLSRESMPSRQSAPSRSRSNDRASTSSRSATRSRASVPSRSSKSSPSRSSRATSTRPSRGTTSNRSRSDGDSRRGGGGRGKERR